MTFISTPNAALFHDAVPVFVDVDPKTGLIDPDAVEAAITPRTRAVIVVHLYGQLADMKRLRAICDKHGLQLIEDAAHAIEAERRRSRGRAGDATVFSFYATKTMTSGDGGAIAVRSRRYQGEAPPPAQPRRLEGRRLAATAGATSTGTWSSSATRRP